MNNKYRRIFMELINGLVAKGKGRTDYSKKSYSQCGEDLIVKYIFDVLGIFKPGYIDIGAHHPYYLSNTALFYENGSIGINIEPDPDLIKAFKNNRKRDINLNIGISDSKSILDFYIVNDPVLNTFSKEEAENYHVQGNYQIVDKKQIEVDTIESVLKNHNKGLFPEFLSIDAEGVDELIVKSLENSENLPIVICIETISFSNDGNGIKNYDIIKFIESIGYLLYADTYINSIFVKKDKWQRKK